MIGQTKRFTFDSRTFMIIEMIENTNISMDWNWGSSVCPHCKNKIDKIITHIFHKIEVLVPKISIDQKKEKSELLKEVKMLGYDNNGKKLLLNNDTEQQVFKLSTFFKEVI